MRNVKGETKQRQNANELNTKLTIILQPLRLKYVTTLQTKGLSETKLFTHMPYHNMQMRF